MAQKRANPGGEAGALKAEGLFAAKFSPDHTTRATPCSQCRRFYSPHLQARGRQWSACNLSATRDPGRSCRWFARVKVWEGAA